MNDTDIATERRTATPAELGFSMPAEFAPHDACWMLWPQRPDNWRYGAKPAQAAFVAVARAIAESETVFVGVNDDQYENARNQLPSHIRVIELSSNDAWMRDVGPTFLTHPDGRLAMVDWEFNAWGGLNGGLYFPWDKDRRIRQKIAEVLGIERFITPLVVEGGAIHVDGEGTLITTEECLLNPNRNPDLAKPEIERLLCAYLGVEKIIWLPRGCFQDETDGHVDNLCCFVAPGEVALTWTDDDSDPQHAISREALGILEAATDARGRRLTVHKLPMPGPLTIAETEASGVDRLSSSRPRQPGDRMAASYVNFYIGNSVVVMPRLDPAHDDEAHAILENLFPDRRVVAVDAREILLGGGNIHCITQQQPRV
ncbi:MULTISPECIES: agmatine deiminase [Chromohalobacter]|uniref:agmatine deiminase n=1 Tax=Chromohalobacter TaxID=42054 RepID=UPI00068EAC34|nr:MULTISPECIES: agmatine deiminase [Chromohalobacter]MBZ5875408.1 agmatine deiminase [Chromohalobacter salexigens]MDF9432971.1 agmatine deiminase [Chromohalobacter israelensis]NQY44810.1 agmatine deiminase [Chromohalobacter sp.]PWW34440.1 agmatine deiminase [Chromohalobacter salexigens]